MRASSQLHSGRQRHEGDAVNKRSFFFSFFRGVEARLSKMYPSSPSPARPPPIIAHKKRQRGKNKHQGKEEKTLREKRG